MGYLTKRGRRNIIWTIVVLFVLAGYATLVLWGHNDPWPAELRSQRALKRYLARGGDPDARYAEGRTLLHWAANLGRSEAVALLLEHGACPNIADNEGLTPVHTATFSGVPACMALLIDAGADVSRRNDNGNTPLHTAAYSGSTRCAELLLKAGADIDAQNNNGDTPLLYTMFLYRQERMLRFLLAAGAAPEITNRQHVTILHRVLSIPAPEMAEVIMQYFDVDKRDERGWTPLHNAVYHVQRSRHWEKAIDMMLQSGADPNAPNSEGLTPLDFAHRYHPHKEPLWEVLTRRLNVQPPSTPRPSQRERRCTFECDATETELEELAAGLHTLAEESPADLPEAADTLLQRAARCGAIAIIETALAFGADIQTRGAMEFTPLHFAAECGFAEAVSVLLNHGANPNSLARGLTPLHMTIAGNDVGARNVIIPILLSSGADPNAKAAIFHNNTVLHLAILSTDRDAVQLLLAGGADPQIVNHNNETALQLARRLEQADIIELLKDSPEQP